MRTGLWYNIKIKHKKIQSDETQFSKLHKLKKKKLFLVHMFYELMSNRNIMQKNVEERQWILINLPLTDAFN